VSRWWLLVVLCGCNQLYGLDKTRTLGPDADGDLVEDDVDNCVDVANPEQDDVDHDGRGDACDGCTGCEPCDVGPDHDEDGDLIPDGCDSCPRTSSSNKSNVDGDDLGDVCDADNNTKQRRLLFDGFAAIDSSWTPIGEWRAVQDAAESIDGPHPFGYRLTNMLRPITGTKEWRAVVGFAVPDAAAISDVIGVDIVNGQDGTVWSCTIELQADGWKLTNGLPTPITIGTSTVMTLSSSRNGTTQRYCQVVGNAEKASAGGFNDAYPHGVQLRTTRPARYDWIEVIE
jgi:hypothetical protein